MSQRMYLILILCSFVSAAIVFGVERLSFQQRADSRLAWIMLQQEKIKSEVAKLRWGSKQELAASQEKISHIAGVKDQEVIFAKPERALVPLLYQKEQDLWLFQVPIDDLDRTWLKVTYDSNRTNSRQPILIYLMLLLIVPCVYIGWRIIRASQQLDNQIQKVHTDLPNQPKAAGYFSQLFNSERKLLEIVESYSESKNWQLDISNQLRQQSLIDPLTGLGNREYFDAELDIQLKSSAQSINGAVILFSFEPLMDSYYENRPKFEDWMEQIGGYFSRFVNETDLSWVARHDLVDFSILLLEHVPDKITRLINQMIHDLERSTFDIAPIKYNFVSAGGVYFVDAEEPYQLLASADMALRHAQLEGANRFHLYTPKNLPKNQVKGSVRWRSFLQNVLDKKTVYLTYQKIHINGDEQQERCEALARVEQSGEVIAAAIFMPMAERCGLARQFDRLIIEKMLSNILTNQSSQTNKVWSINLFAESLLDKAFYLWLYSLLEEHPEYTRYLIFEINEFAVSHGLSSFKEPITRLTALGCRFCVEKVGNPNANLEYLRELEIESIKLSQSIIRHLEKQKEADAFVKSLIAIAHQENTLVFAEGVEKESEWLHLKELGVDGGQGYYFSDD